MSTEQPFDTDQPLFPGADGKVDELIKQVNVMEGYGSQLRSPEEYELSPKKDDNLRRKSRMKGVTTRGGGQNTESALIVNGNN